MRSTIPARMLLASAVLLASACAVQPKPAPGPESASRMTRGMVASGDAHRRSGRGEEAIRAYARAVDADPASVPPHLRYVSTLLERGRRSEARRIYRERVASPRATDADRTMSQRLETDGASSALRRVYTAATMRTPSSPWWQLALAEVEIAEADAWSAQRRLAVERGDRAEEVKALEEAHAALARANRAVERGGRVAPSLAEVDLYRGLLRAFEGDLHVAGAAKAAAYEAAEVAYARAVVRDADLVEAWEGLGDVRLRNGDLRGSLLAFLEATKRAPSDPRLRTSVGVVLQRIGRNEDAAIQHRQAAVLAPRDPRPLLRMGDARADEEQWDEALAAYAEALRRDGEAIEAHYKRGAVFEHLGRLGEARASYERYVSQGGERASSVKRRVERILRAEHAVAVP